MNSIRQKICTSAEKGIWSSARQHITKTLQEKNSTYKTSSSLSYVMAFLNGENGLNCLEVVLYCVSDLLHKEIQSKNK